ncbi:MAG: hypothetical protein J0L88_11285 [Xanthomonadales bacterium]|nr:hypothetical protein [Xanthomonadales bacterium]
MHRCLRWLWTVLLAGLVCASTASADTTFTYQGELTNNGVPATGSFDFRFILYSDELGGSQVGPIVTRNAVAVSDGVFTVPLDFGANFGTETNWLEIAVKVGGGGSYTLLSPRQPLTPATHALGLVLPMHAFAGPSAGPNAALTLSHLGDGPALWVSNSGSESTLLSQGSGTGGGIYSSVGSSGQRSALTAYNYGTQRYGLETEIVNPSSPRTAIFARTSGTGNAIGAEVNSNTTATALYARTTSNQNGSFAASFTGPVRVDCAAASCNTTQALRITGNTQVVGTLSKSAGSFRIDHPLDPEGKYLSHSFVESPDMKNLYDGVVTLDGNGSAVVTMPDWFEALNREFRYQLTGIGAPSPGAYIAEEIRGNRFAIAGGTPYAKISWMVTGTRHDAYAEKFRIPVEEDKPADERGRYLVPEAYGQPADRGIHGPQGVPAILPAPSPVEE